MSPTKPARFEAKVPFITFFLCFVRSGGEKTLGGIGDSTWCKPKEKQIWDLTDEIARSWSNSNTKAVFFSVGMSPTKLTPCDRFLERKVNVSFSSINCMAFPICTLSNLREVRNLSTVAILPSSTCSISISYVSLSRRHSTTVSSETELSSLVFTQSQYQGANFSLRTRWPKIICRTVATHPAPLRVSIMGAV